jgi:hypothetical protein
MSRGPSGRIVVEIDPDVKVRLYEQIEGEGTTFKQWLLAQIDRFLSSRGEAPAAAAAADHAPLQEQR